MNAEWKGYVDDVRELIKQDEPYVTRLLKLIEAQDAVVKAAEEQVEFLRRVGMSPPPGIDAALRNLAELKLE